MNGVRRRYAQVPLWMWVLAASFLLVVGAGLVSDQDRDAGGSATDPTSTGQSPSADVTGSSEPPESSPQDAPTGVPGNMENDGENGANLEEDAPPLTEAEESDEPPDSQEHEGDDEPDDGEHGIVDEVLR